MMRVVLLVSLCVVATGCGTTSAPSLTPSHPTSAAATDVCALLATGEAEQQLGKPTLVASPASVPVSGCVWSVPQSVTPLDTSSIAVTQQSLALFEAAEAAGNQNGIATRPVSGLGDRAFYESSAQTTLLLVRKGSNAVSIGVSNHDFSADQIEAAEKAIAQLIVARM